MYSINVATRDTRYPYVHFCRVDAGETEDHARRVFAVMREKFPAPNYHVEMTKWTTTGETVQA